MSLSDYEIRSFQNKIQLTDEDITSLLKPITHIRIEDVEKIPLDMYVLLLETNNLIAQSGDTVSLALEHAIEKLGYSSSH